MIYISQQEEVPNQREKEREREIPELNDLLQPSRNIHVKLNISKYNRCLENWRESSHLTYILLCETFRPNVASGSERELNCSNVATSTLI